MRSISHAHGIYGQLKRLGIGYSRFDDLMLILEETLCKHPEAFPVIPGTKVILIVLLCGQVMQYDHLHKSTIGAL